jgi:ABC-type dipeptide/oligopeptide/nickel transport system permease component
VAQFVALTATYAIYFASMALVEEKTHSSAQMGLMIFSSTLPGFLFALLALVVLGVGSPAYGAHAGKSG